MRSALSCLREITRHADLAAAEFSGLYMSNRQILDDEEFWTRLEYDASQWLQSSNDKELRRHWVDGFTPTNAVNTKRGLDAEGVAWVMGEGGCEYRFLVSIPQKLLHRKKQKLEIESLSLDKDQRVLEVVVSCGRC